jgi:glycosyltransferase involved in cell wall biosynthesis
MRIAFVICGDLAHVSGGFHYDGRLIDGLRALGHAVAVISLPWHGYARAGLDNLAPWPFTAGDHDVVIQDELCHPAVFLRNRQLRRAGVPVVSLVHNLASCQPDTRARAIVRACERHYLRGVDAVIAVCAGTAADVRACAGRDLPTAIARAGRDEMIGEVAIDETHVRERAHAPGPLRLVFVGQVDRHKGLHRLLPALAEQDRAAVTLDVAGSLVANPGYVQKVRAQAVRLGVADRVRWHGLLPRAEVAALLARSHVAVLPSDREAYPLAALEALGAGLALLMTSAGGTPELLGDGAAGQLLAPDDTAAWAGAIARYARDRAALAAAGQAAVGRHRAHGSWSETAAGVAEFLRGVVQNRRRSA